MKTDPMAKWLAKRIPKLRSFPLYNQKAFTRHLQDKQWRWYSHDPGTLRAADGEYRRPKNLYQDNFTWFDRRQLDRRTLLLEERVLDIVSKDSFLDDAAKGDLRAVSWIDPNFVDVSVLDPHSNDDHPPADILAGQQLVYEVYDALRNSPNWDDTLLVVTYDEHGGFYDHVTPPAVADHAEYETLGLRVPALVVGPRVKRFVCHEPPDEDAWDHTALIRSALMVALKDHQPAIDAMGGRVAGRKAHLGHMLEDAPLSARRRRSRGSPEEALVEWRERARGLRRAASPGELSKAPDGAGQPFVLTDLQDDMLTFSAALRESGRVPFGP
jgi:phospholipase C